MLGFLGLFGNPLLIFIAIFVYLAATPRRSTSRCGRCRGLPVGDAMETRIATLRRDGARWKQAVETLLRHRRSTNSRWWTPSASPSASSCEKTSSRRSAEERDASILEFARAPVVGVRANAPLQPAFDDMRTTGAAAVSVVGEGGGLLGLLTPQNVAEMMMIKQARPDWRFGR